MRELTRLEADQTGGGGIILTAFLVSVGAGIVTSYAYEKMGGSEGIKEGIKRVVDHFKEHARKSE